MIAMPARCADLIAGARDAGHSCPVSGRALGMSHVGAMKAANGKPSPGHGSGTSSRSNARTAARWRCSIVRNGTEVIATRFAIC